MNNILEEITYSDGRMDDVVKSLYTPAKLKLRARTYDGINKSLSKRRGVVSNSSFKIPNAFMPTASSSTGNESGYSVTDSIGLDNASVRGQKRLKISQSQIEGLSIFRLTNKEQGKDNEKPQQQVVLPETIEKKKEDINTVVPSIPDPLDVAREKVLNVPDVQDKVGVDQNVQQVTINNDGVDAVSEVEETDVFKQLEKETGEYAKIDEEYKKSTALLEDSENALASSKSDYENIEDHIKKTNEKIDERSASIDSSIKEKEEIERQIKEIEVKTREKIRLINFAKEQRLREKKNNEEKIEQIKTENKAYQEKIAKKNEEVSALEAKEQDLKKQADALIDAKREAQERYNKKLAIFDAITLPEGIESEYISSQDTNVGDGDYSYKKVM